MFKVLGVNDDKNFCECCGKQGLKKVVFIENLETNEIKHFGTTCAKSPKKGFGVNKEIEIAISAFKAKQALIQRNAWKLYKQKGGEIIFVDGGFKCVNSALLEKCYKEVV